MTLPGTLVSIYYDFLLHSDTGTIILYIGDSIDITYHALNCIVLIFTNKIFRTEANSLLCRKSHNNERTVSTSLNH